MFILSIILSAASLPIVCAAPWQKVYVRQSRGDDASTGSSIVIWAPIVAVGVFVLLAGLVVFREKRRLANSRTGTSGNAVSNGTSTTATGQARELTAAELTGGTRPTTAAARRPRRPRRTPSQVSTRSLPAYMKEPGAHEVVIYRGLEDMDEDAEGEQRNVNDSTTTPDMTLNTESTDRDSHEITRTFLPPRTDSPESIRHSAHLSRNSYDHHGSDESHARLIDVRRGQAPAYETIDLDVMEVPAPVHPRHNSQSARIPGFFSRFMPHRANNSTANDLVTLSSPPNAQNFSPSHSREPSAQSGVPGAPRADPHSSPTRSRIGQTHRDRNNNLSTGSVFTVLSKTLSRNHDDGPLTSPSMISLNSISPPFTHTTTRTEFTYPRTGPTSEQIKFLSSKETFGRFALPYGPDAVAFAASSSRQDLPPDFDSIHRPSFSDLPPNHDGRSTSNLGRPTSMRRLSGGDHSDRGESPFPESVEPSSNSSSLTDPPSQLSLSKQKSTSNLGVNALTSPSQLSLSKQKSTPNLSVGRPPLSKSSLKSKSMANLQNDRDGSLPPRSVSATGSYFTVESFQTAHDDGDGSAPPSPMGALGPVPQIMVQLPSNDPSSTNLAEDGSGSETEEFFDGDEGTEGSESGDEEGEGANDGGNKTPRAPSMNENIQPHAEGGDQEVGGDNPCSTTDEGDSESSVSESSPRGPQGTCTRTSTSSSSLDSESGSDESEVETHSNNTEVDKTFVTTDSETSRMRHIYEGTDVTLTPEMVAATLDTRSPDLTKTSESRTAAVEA